MRLPTAMVGMCLACNSPRTGAIDPGPKGDLVTPRLNTVLADRSLAPDADELQLAPGQAAPDVTLTLHNGKTLQLSELRGKNVVLFFYPMDDTPGCRAEARGFRDHYDQFLSKNSVVLGVSLQGAESHRAFIDKEKLPFDLVVDNRASVSKAFGVPIHGSVTARQTFLLDSDGKISKIWREVSPHEHARRVLSNLPHIDVASSE